MEFTEGRKAGKQYFYSLSIFIYILSIKIFIAPYIHIKWGFIAVNNGNLTKIRSHLEEVEWSTGTDLCPLHCDFHRRMKRLLSQAKLRPTGTQFEK